MKVQFRPDARILIVDDQVTNIELLRSILGAAGYENIASTINSTETIQLIRSWSPDILLLDLSMPIMSGLDVLRQITELMPTRFLPILVLTADNTLGKKHEALSLGATDFLTKPFDLKEVLYRIRNLLGLGFHSQLLETRVEERTRDLQDANLRLEAAQEEVVSAVQTRNEFLANMNHELRTPMNGILGLTHILRETLIDEEALEILDLITLSSQRLHVVLDEILTMSMLETGRPVLNLERVDLDKLVGESVDLYRAEAFKKRIEIELLPPEAALPIAYADGGKLKQVLTHLIGNAIKFTETGVVSVGWTHELHGRTTQFCCSVSDSGIGIPEDAQARVFEPFVQVDGSNSRAYEGVGLGLAVSKRLVDLMGGQISLTSAVGIGTTVRILVDFQHQIEAGLDDAKNEAFVKV